MAMISYLAANTAHKLIDGLLVVYAVNTELLFDESTKLGVGNSELVINSLSTMLFCKNLRRPLLSLLSTMAVAPDIASVMLSNLENFCRVTLLDTRK